MFVVMNDRCRIYQLLNPYTAFAADVSSLTVNTPFSVRFLLGFVFVFLILLYLWIVLFELRFRFDVNDSARTKLRKISRVASCVS